MKNGNGGRDVLDDTMPVDRKLRTALGANQVAGFVTVPSEKKINLIIITLLLHLTI